jgi:hypothetical protein
MRQGIPSPCFILLAGLTLAGCGDRTAGPAAPSGGAALAGRTAEQPRPKTSNGKVRTRMQGVAFRINPSVVLEIDWLHGELVPTKEGEPPWFDDPSSFVLQIDEGEIAITPASMSAMMNQIVFAYPNAPLSDIEIEIVGDHLRQTATIKKKIPIRATLEGEVSATPEGKIRLHPTSIKTGKLPVKKLLDLFGIELDEMVHPKESRGVSLRDDDLFLDPERLLPPPRIRGKVTAVRLENGRIVQVFGGGPKRRALEPSVKLDNYMYFKGGDLKFGKLTMHDADLEIADKDPKDPFDFFLERFSQQLVAGYSKTLPDKGLVSYMPDSDEVGKK